MAELIRGTEQEPPTSGPAPKTGLKVIYVSCGQTSTGCSGPGAALAAAGKLLGWSVQTFDGKFDVGGGYAIAIRQAIAAKPNAIAMVGIDCDQIQQPLAEAKAAGIPVVGINGSDCNSEGGPKLFAAEPILRSDAPTEGNFYEAWGRQKVDYLMDKLHGHVNLIDVSFIGVVPQINEGVVSEMAKCSTCKIVADVGITTDEAASPEGPTVPGVKAALLAHPDANALLVPFDTQLIDTGLLQALKNDPGAKNLVVLGGEGTPEGIAALKSGPPPSAEDGYSAQWLGWALADIINRVLNHSPQVPEGIGTRVIQKSNVGTATEYEPAVNFKAAYMKAWGLTK